MESLDEDKDHPLMALHRRWAVYALQQLALNDLSLKPSLFECGFKFLISIGDVGARVSEISAHFDHEIQPITADISIVENAPVGFTPVVTVTTHQEDMWSAHRPLSAGDMNRMLALISGKVPKGGIDYIHQTRRWQFQHFGIDDAGRKAVQDACATLGISDEIQFVEITPSVPSTPEQSVSHIASDPLGIGTRHSVVSANNKIRNLVECDEDAWRTFVSTRGYKRDHDESALGGRRRFACLYDTRDESPVQLAELLTLYDVVNIVPSEDLQWMDRHRLTLTDLEVMAASGRVRLVLPASINRYPESVVLAATSQSHEGVVLSRNLAMQVVRSGERKDPLLYGPFTMSERTAFLRLLRQSAGENFNIPLSIYSSSVARQGLEYAMRGANAVYGIGFGPFLGEMFYRLRGIDARIEMSTIGAAVEWAMGLGAAYVPRQMGGFDETRNASIVASYVSRSRCIPREPLANRMHTVVDGLLAVTDVPPIEVAKNFTSSAVSRFRQAAMGLINGPADPDEITGMMEKLNEEVRAFESRRKFLAKWKADAIAISLATKLATDTLDAEFGPWTSWFASVGAGYLYSMMKNTKAFATASEVSQELIDTFVGLAMAPSNDAVVMWRARERLKR